MEKVAIFDTTLRDGEQSPGFGMTAVEKLLMARQLERLGVDAVEAGFPAASPGDFDAVRRIADQVRGCEVVALGRARPEDIVRAWEAVREAARPRLHTFLATSAIHLTYKLKLGPDEALRRIVAAVRQARDFCARVEFSAEDATRTDLGFLREAVHAAVEAGATVINLPDTVGYATPEEIGQMFRAARESLPTGSGVVLSAHCHNDLGLAVANSIAAVQAGARQVECTVNGIGERAGNAALEEVVMALATRRELFGVGTGVRTGELCAASRLLSEVTGVRPQPNKAVVGRNAFAHEAGIHQHGVLANPLTYEIMTPQSVGAPPSALVLGKHSGRHALAARLAELGHHLPTDRVDAIYEPFCRLADRKKTVSDDDLRALVAEAAPEVRPAPLTLREGR